MSRASAAARTAALLQKSNLSPRAALMDGTLHLECCSRTLYSSVRGPCFANRSFSRRKLQALQAQPHCPTRHTLRLTFGTETINETREHHHFHTPSQSKKVVHCSTGRALNSPSIHSTSATHNLLMRLHNTQSAGVFGIRMPGVHTSASVTSNTIFQPAILRIVHPCGAEAISHPKYPTPSSS